MADLEQDRSAWFLSMRWASRRESAQVCAEKIEQFLDGLSSIDDRFARWLMTARRKNVAQTALQRGSALVEYLSSRCVQRKEVPPRDVIEDLGFSLSVWTGDRDGMSASLAITCGGFNARVPNVCTLTPKPPFFIARDALRRLIEVSVDVWRPAILIVSSDRLLNSYIARYGESLQVGWSTYLPSLPSALMHGLPRVAEAAQFGSGWLIDLRDSPSGDSLDVLESARDLQQKLRSCGVIPAK